MDKFAHCNNKNTCNVGLASIAKDKYIKNLERKIDIKDKWCLLLRDIACDYDRHRTAESLMSLIDELSKMAENAIQNDDESEVYISENGIKSNILNEPLSIEEKNT